MEREQDLSKLMQQASRGFAERYEQNIYAVYNLALRICCDAQAARKAVKRTFLLASEEQGDGPALLGAAARLAVSEAPAKPSLDGAGDEASKRMLRATSTLPAPERAALALAFIGDADADAVASALDLGSDVAAQLLWRGAQGLGSALGGGPDQVEAAYRSWLWAEPPMSLWDETYKGFYVAEQKRLARPARRPAASRAPATGRVARAQRLLGVLLRLVFLALVAPFRFLFAHLPRRAAVAASLLLVIAAVAGASRLGGGGGSDPFGAATDPYGAAYASPGESASGEDGKDGGKSGKKPYDPLSPEELDRLRLQELKDLARYQRKQANKRLSQDDRSEAAAEARRIVALAREREKSVRVRETRARRQYEALVRYRDKLRRRAEKGDDSQPAKPVSPAGSAPSGSGRGGADGRSSDPRKDPQKKPSDPSDPQTREEAEATCLRDVQAGTFICPQ